MIHKWKFISRKTLFDHPRMTIVEDEVLLPNNKQIAYIREAPSKNHSVAIVALDNQGRILLQREYSYPPDKVMYQLPGGAAEDEEGVIDAANRELSEESGYIAKDTTVIGSFYLNNRRSDRKQFIVQCKDIVPQRSTGDEEEFIESEWVSLGKVRMLIQQGKIENVNLLAALALLDAVRA